MSYVVGKTDVTALLPDEVLCHVFSFLTLSEKLQSEAVNPKFQRCVVKELRDKPQPLKLELWLNELNGYNVRSGLFLAPLRALAKRSKFSSIILSLDLGFSDGQKLMRRILSVLVLEYQSLSKVTSFETDSACDQAVLEVFLDKCDKLSIIRFHFRIRPLNSEPGGFTTHPLDLCQLFKNRGLTELRLQPFRYEQNGLVGVFRGMKANSLRKVNLSLEEMPLLDVAELVNAMHSNAGTTLEEIRLQLREVPVQLVDLLESLAQFSALQKCDIDYLSQEPVNQFVPAMASLFKLSHVNIAVGLEYFTVPGCQIVNMINQIKIVHPGLVADFSVGSRSLMLSLGKASARKRFRAQNGHHCGAEECTRCQSFYPALLRFLRLLARQAVINSIPAQHFPSWQLDRCRVGPIVADLNDLNLYASRAWKALSVEATEDQQSVTINFEAQVAHQHQFSITIGSGRCLNNGCMKC